MSFTVHAALYYFSRLSWLKLCHFDSLCPNFGKENDLKTIQTLDINVFITLLWSNNVLQRGGDFRIPNFWCIINPYYKGFNPFVILLFISNELKIRKRCTNPCRVLKHQVRKNIITRTMLYLLVWLCILVYIYIKKERKGSFMQKLGRKQKPNYTNTSLLQALLNDERRRSITTWT